MDSNGNAFYITGVKVPPNFNNHDVTKTSVEISYGNLRNLAIVKSTDAAPQRKFIVEREWNFAGVPMVYLSEVDAKNKVVKTVQLRDEHPLIEEVFNEQNGAVKQFYSRANNAAFDRTLIFNDKYFSLPDYERGLVDAYLHGKAISKDERKLIQPTLSLLNQTFKIEPVIINLDDVVEQFDMANSQN